MASTTATRSTMIKARGDRFPSFKAGTGRHDRDRWHLSFSVESLPDKPPDMRPDALVK